MSETLVTIDPDDSSEMAKDLALDRAGRIATLKGQLKSAINRYRILCNDDYPQSRDIEAYLRPNMAEAAYLCNELARRLQELDPHMPDWVEIPIGRNLYPAKR